MYKYLITLTRLPASPLLLGLLGGKKKKKSKTVEHFLLVFFNEPKELPQCSSTFFVTAVVACMVTRLHNSW